MKRVRMTIKDMNIADFQTAMIGFETRYHNYQGQWIVKQISICGNVVMLYVYDRFFMPGKNKTGYEGNLPAIRIVQKETGPDSVLDIGFQWEKRKLLCHLPVYALMLVPIVLLLSVLAFTDLTSDLFAALTVICSCTAVSFCGLYLLVKVHVQYRKMMRVLVELLEKNFLAETVND